MLGHKLVYNHCEIMDLRFKGCLTEDETTSNATLSLSRTSLSLGLGLLECTTEGLELKSVVCYLYALGRDKIGWDDWKVIVL
jgi:hypothetical protein